MPKPKTLLKEPKSKKKAAQQQVNDDLNWFFAPLITDFLIGSGDSR